ncbi:DNA-binding transcriptional regulator, GntR family [Variovorax sp. HW608]|uniref:GntR family transcriptional regulator n=1 Tax=Variovorax sp. HW608 TaxID=1034889 RepID=UPI00081F9BF5|nr:GntR family transcriptional regulator [Variovorax sp. HW608]SCK20209.1 DNA-binding transcriptional regulator, GntR family [Variovorax sp. HW608]
MEKIASRRQADIAEEPSKRARGSVPEEVFQRLRRGLMVGAFVPGQVMSLRKLAASFGTSPMPIREALTRLVVINALEDTTSGSVRVPRLTPKKLNELFAVRELIEGMATEMACNNCTPALLKSLTNINNDLLEAIAKRNLIGCLSSNQRFHFTLYEASGTEVVMPLVESLWLQFGPTMYLSLLSPDMPWDASAHVEILEGLRAKKPGVAKRGVLRDIRNTAQSLAPALAELQATDLLSAPLDDLYFGN